MNLKNFVTVFFSCNILISFFCISFNSMLRLYSFPFTSRVFSLISWNIVIKAALMFCLIVSTLCHLRFGVCLLSFPLHNIEIFLVLHMLRNFEMYLGHFEFYSSLSNLLKSFEDFLFCFRRQSSQLIIG